MANDVKGKLGVADFAEMKRRVRASFLVKLSGLQPALLFFLSSFETWQEHRAEMFKDNAEKNIAAIGEAAKAIIDLEERNRSLENHRNALQASNTMYLERARKAENALRDYLVMQKDKDTNTIGLWGGSKLWGTSECPICGVGSPHTHTAEEVIAHREQAPQLPLDGGEV